METRKLRHRKQISYYEPAEPPNDAYVYCENCRDFVLEYCSIHGKLLVVIDGKVPARMSCPDYPLAMLTAPPKMLYFGVSSIPGAGMGVFANVLLPRGARFGPYRGQRIKKADTGYSWQIYDNAGRASHVVDASDASRSNWMRYVNCSRHSSEQNLVAYQFHGEIYYRTTKFIEPKQELLVFYGREFAMDLNIHVGKYNSKDGNKLTYVDKTIKYPESETQYPTIDLPEASKSISAETSRDNDYALLNFDRYFNEKRTPDEVSDRFVILRHFENADKGMNPQNGSKQIFNKEPILQARVHAPFNDTESVGQKPNFNITDKHNQNILVLSDSVTQTDYANTRNTEAKDVDPNAEKRIWNCNFCNHVLSSRDRLRNHRRIHGGTQKFNCTLCNYKTDVKYYFQRHEQTHRKPKNAKKTKPATVSQPSNKSSWECVECRNVFETRERLRNHRRTHAGSLKFNCNLCEYATDVKYFIDKHRSKHQNESTNKRTTYKCNSCNFSSYHRKVFEVHIGLHANIKAIKCDMCDYLSISRKYMHAHLLRVHVPTKRYQCGICASAFNCAEYLRKHINNVH